MDNIITPEELKKGILILDYSATIIVTNDGLEAKVIPVHNDLPPESWEDILKFLKKSPIVYGILDKPEIQNKVWFVARGLMPENGTDARIEFRKPSDRLDLPIYINEIVNKNIICYEKGEIIAEKILNTKGIPGKNILGEEIPSEPGKWIPFPVGNNVEIFSEDQFIRAMCDGKLEIIDEKISIVENYKINGSADHLLGNIIFKGKLLEISGGIENGINVKVVGDLIVSGGIENSNVYVSGNLTVKGVISGENCKIFVQKNSVCNIIEQAKIIVNGDLTIKNYILDSDCLCHGNITLQEKKGMILGGFITFGKKLTVNTIGSDQNTTTHIYGGFLNIHVEEYEELKNIYQVNLKKLSDIKKGLEKIEEIEKVKELDEKFILIRKKLKNGIIDIVSELKILKEKISNLEIIINNSPAPELIVNQVIYPGVSVTINNASLEVKNEIKNVKIKFYEGKIIYMSL